MKRSKAVIWGVLIFIAAAGLLVFAFRPDLAIFTVPVWKWIAAILLVYWIVHKIVFGRKLTTKLTIFLPLALLFMVFEREIGTLIGRGPNFVNNWILLAAAILLNCGVYFIFRSKNKSYGRSTSSFRFSGNGKISDGTSDGAVDGDGTRDADSGESAKKRSGQARVFRMGDNVCYIDASEPSASVVNRLGSLNVFYQNTDVGDLSQPLELNIVNQLGSTVVHVPRNWHVEMNGSSNSMGDINCRPDANVTIRTLTVNGVNTMGELSIVSDD